MSKNIKKQFKQLKAVAPDMAWQKRQRDILMAEIDSTVGKPAVKQAGTRQIWQAVKILWPANLLWRLAKPVVALLVVFAVALSGGIATVGASMNSLPGDALYGVKMATEKMRLTFTPSDIEKAKLQLEFANDRLAEVDKLSQRTDPKKSAKIKVAVDSFKKGLDNIQEHITQAKETGGDSLKILEAATAINDQTDEMAVSLEETKEKLQGDKQDKQVEVEEEEENQDSPEKNQQKEQENEQALAEASQAVDSALHSLRSTSFEVLRILVFRENTEKVVVSDHDIKERLSLEFAKIKDEVEIITNKFKKLSDQAEEEKIDYSKLDDDLKLLKNKFDETLLALDVINKKLTNDDFKSVFNAIDYHADLLGEISQKLDKKMREQLAAQAEQEETVPKTIEEESLNNNDVAGEDNEDNDQEITDNETTGGQEKQEAENSDVNDVSNESGNLENITEAKEEK